MRDKLLVRAILADLPNDCTANHDRVRVGGGRSGLVGSGNSETDGDRQRGDATNQRNLIGDGSSNLVLNAGHAFARDVVEKTRAFFAISATRLSDVVGARSRT